MSSTPTLYDLGTEWQRLMAAVSDDGELDPETERELEDLDLALAWKVEAVCCVIRELDARAEGRAAEAKRLADLAASDKRGAGRLRARLLEHLQRTGQAKVETARFRVWAQRNSAPTIDYAGPAEALPEEFRRVKVELDAAAVRKAISEGRPIPPGVLVEQGSHLRIK